MGRKILFVTTDQQRYDTLGCNGGTLARTPVVDALAAAGHRYERAHPQSVVCMPSRSTMITGQHPSTHGVWMNGVPLPVDAPSVADGAARRRVPHGADRQAALRAVPRPVRPLRREPLRPRRAWSAPHRGFEHFEAATHGGAGPLHYARWLAADHPEAVGMFYPVLDGAARGQRRRRRRHRRAAGARQPDPARVVPHRLGGRSDDRVARLARRRRRLVLLDELPRSAPPVGSAGVRAGPRRLARRAAAGRLHRGRRRRASASSTPSRATGGRGTTARLVSNYEAPRDWVPATLTADQVREVNARNAVECELIDEALGRVLAADRARAAGATTSTSSSRPTTASCRATSACCSRARTTSTG